MDNHTIQCFYAVKSGADTSSAEQPSQKTEVKKESKKQPSGIEAEDELVSLAQTSANVPFKGRKGFRTNQFADHSPSAESDLEITEHNS